MKIITVNKNDSGQRTDKFLAKFLPNMPKSLLYKQLRKKRVKRNKKALGAQDILHEGDELYLYINDEFFKDKPLPQSTASEKPAIIYEDENILIADKPAGQASHGGNDSLLAEIQSYLYATGVYDPAQEHSFAPALSNRLDRNTRGLVLAAKNAQAQKALNNAIKEGHVSKQYLCLVHGSPKPERGQLQSWLQISSAENKVTAVKKDTPGAKEARLSYRILKKQDGKSLLEITLLTGRKHQIRVQLAELGHPLLGDTKYGAPKDKSWRYQALCAYRITFKENIGCLAYLDGKSFEIKNHPFCDMLGDSPASPSASI